MDIDHRVKIVFGRSGQEGYVMEIDFKKLPKFKNLPVKEGAPAESSWGVFGDDDELGCLNFLTPKGVIDAARLVRKGRVFRLDTAINYAKPPLFNRNPARHTILSFEQYGLLGHDDSIDNYNTQEGSQWDGLGHVGHIRHRAFYNGVTDDQIKDGPGGKLSIHKWSNRFVGRGVLIDVCKYVTEQGRPIDPLSSAVYSLKDIQDALKAQGTRLRPGSILLVRTGWMGAYQAASSRPARWWDGCGTTGSRRSARIVRPSSRGPGISRTRARCTIGRFRFWDCRW